jgi:excisionase family DNA binding protein
MVSTTTIHHVRTFCKPAIETGIIPSDQFQELMKLAKSSHGTDQTQGERKMLTVNQVASVLACSTRTVHRMKDTGRLPGVYLTKSRKSLRFRSDAVEAVMEGAK